MYCKHCGNQIADDAIFCSHCGTKLIENAEPAPPQAASKTVAQPQVSPEPVAKPQVSSDTVAQAEEIPAKPFLEGMEWNVSEYPDSNTVEKTDDIDFDWGIDPQDVPEKRAEAARQQATREAEAARGAVEAAPKATAAEDTEAARVAGVFDRVVPAEKAKASIPVQEALEAANKVDAVGQFNTFNRKNAQFQELLDREYEKVKGAGTIANEQIQADETAERKFDSRQDEMTMDDFLQNEGVVKLYEPKEVETDVLDRIAALDKQKAKREAEEAARIKALEEARAEALAKKKEEEEARRAAEDAARLEAIAKRQAEEEARSLEESRRQAAEEARAKAEAEARAREEEIARAKAEREAKAQAEETARLKAEADLKAAQEAARIRAQQEVAKAAREEAEFKAAQQRREREEELARLKKEAEDKQRARAENYAEAEDEVRKALEQTARMREQEEEKIKAALAGIRGGRFSDTISSTEKAVPEPIEEAPVVPEVEPAAGTPAEPAVEAAAEVEASSDTIKDTILAPRDKIEEAHRHTRYNIEGMAKAREDFFADLPGGDPEEERRAEREAAREAKAERPVDPISPLTRTVDKEAIAAGLSSTKKLSRDDLLSQFASVVDGTSDDAPEDAPVDAPVEDAPVDAPEVVEPEAITPEEITPETITPEEIVPESITPEEIVPESITPEEIVPEAITPEEIVPEEITPEAAPEQLDLEETFAQDEGFVDIDEMIDEKEAEIDPSLAALIAEKPGLEDTMVMPEINRIDELTNTEINEYGQAEADELRRLKEAAAFQQAEAQESAAAVAAEMAAVQGITTEPDVTTSQNLIDEIQQDAQALQQQAEVAPAMTGEVEQAVETEQVDDAPFMTDKERKKAERARAREEKKAAKAKKKEDKRKEKEEIIEDTFGEDETGEIVEPGEEPKSKGGKGRTILMIILILLCVVFAMELVGIGIKMFASTSPAADFIDNILNKLINLITKR